MQSKSKILLVIAFLGLLAIIGFYLQQNRTMSTNVDSGDQPSVVEKIVEVLQPAPTPFPFQELTIPYLRSRTYEGKLGDLELLSQDMSYKSYLTSFDSDGFRVNGLLTIPTTDAPVGGYPAIVFVHGYIPPTVYKTTSNYNSYVDYLARRGFVVFKIDLRGHDQSEGIAMGAYYSGDYVVDILNAYSALQNTDFVDPARIGLWGHSMAGNVIFRSFVAKQDIPAISIWAGAVYTYEDLSQFGIDDNSYRPPVDNSQRQKYRDELNATHGSFDTTSDFWQQVPATNYLSGVHGAVQLNHAVDDNVVSIDYSKNLVSILSGTAITHEFNEFAYGGHNISGSQFSSAMQATVDFFNSHL